MFVPLSVMKALAHSCLTITRVPDGLPCNPAMVPFNKKSNLSAESLLSNGLANYERVRNILNGNIDQNAIDGLFS